MKKVHFMGIGGSGCSGVAAIAQAFSYHVDGCDLAEGSFTDYLSEKNIPVLKGHDPSHLKDVDLLVISPAITSLDTDNLELQKAKERGMPVMTWQEFTGRELQKDKFVIAVAGTHGKSTTTALIGLMMDKAGLDPTVLVGAEVKEWGRNFRLGKSQYFLIEADEYNNNFLNYQANVGVITVIEFDHPEFFADIGQVESAFEKFVSGFKQESVLIKSPSVSLTNPKGKTISFKERSFEMKIPGRFNQLNASIAYETGNYLGIESSILNEIILNFSGVKRRFELVSQVAGIKIYDDYAHHPTAIKQTLMALRQKFPSEQLWVVFQPHMFSRTKALFGDFVKVFKEASVDKIIITDIFPSREKDTGLVHSRDLVQAIGQDKAQYLPSIPEAVNYLSERVAALSVVMVMGAGDINNLSLALKERLQNE